MTLVVCDSDTIRLAGGLVGSGDVQDTIDVDVEDDLNLRNTMGSRGIPERSNLPKKSYVSKGFFGCT
jgi:hypothetical protein